MKRRLRCTLLALGLIGSLTACSSGNTGGQGQQNPPSSSSSQGSLAEDTGNYTFSVNGVSVSIGQDMEEVRSGLGKEQSYFEAASCAFEGLDKTYTYSGFTITTRPEGEKDFVNSILLTDDSVTTERGIYIGSTREDVISAYGEGGETDTVIRYSKDNTTLNFILKDNKVISIEYLPT